MAGALTPVAGGGIVIPVYGVLAGGGLRSHPLYLIRIMPAKGS